MKMTHHTRGSLPPKGKRYIFVHSAAEDREMRDRLTERILALPKGADYCLWHAEDPEVVFQEAGCPGLLSMLVFIPLITENYLSLSKRKGAVKRKDGGSFLTDLMQRGIAVLPVFDKPETVFDFNEQIGNMHGIFLSNPEADRLLAAQLDRFLPDSKITERIMQQAFRGKIFLSYRKADVQEAIRIMKAIHDTDAARRAAIWFDEFLEAGRDFNDEIRKMLSDCDAVAFVVTPNLVKKGNYVLEEEYPVAVQMGKKLIPIQAQNTDAEQIATELPRAGKPVDVTDREAIEALLKKAGFSAADDLSPLTAFLLGMAFLGGIGVEKDETRALALLEFSADEDCVEACEEMSFLYLAGIAVKRDLDRSLEYKLKAYRLLMKETPSAERTDRLYNLLFERDGLCLLLASKDRCDENRRIARAFLDSVDETDDGDGKYTLYRAEACIDIADEHFDPPGSERADEAISCARKVLDLLNAYNGNDPEQAQHYRAEAYSALSAAYERKADIDMAISFAKMAKVSAVELEQRTQKTEHKEQARNCSMSLGNLYFLECLILARTDMNPALSITRGLPALRERTDTMRRARELMEISPTINNREAMALTLYNYALSLPVGRNRRRCFAEAYEMIWKLQRLTDDDSFDSDVATLGKSAGFFARMRIHAGKTAEPITMDQVYQILRDTERKEQLYSQRR